MDPTVLTQKQRQINVELHNPATHISQLISSKTKHKQISLKEMVWYQIKQLNEKPKRKHRIAKRRTLIKYPYLYPLIWKIW